MARSGIATGQGQAPEARPPKPPVWRRLSRIVGELALTLAALLGVLVSGITVFAARSGVEPLVVRSGSMEPTITTGSMVLTKKVEASAIKVGDIVTVQRPDRTRVTHRVIGLERQGEAVALSLKGDANEDPDPVPVTVRHAQRVIAQLPHVGRAMAWLASAQGGFVMGCVVTAFVARAVRRRCKPSTSPPPSEGPGTGPSVQGRVLRRVRFQPRDA